MRRFAAGLALLWLAACGGEPAPQAPPASPALWQVTAPGGQTGWLFGTIHALPDGYDWQTPDITGAVDGAGVLVVEIADLGDTAKAQAAFADAARGAGLPPLLMRVAPADRAGLAAALGRAGMAEGDFTHIDSWAAALMIANAMATNDSGNGVDRTLIATGKPVIGLESFTAQFAIFDGLAETDQGVLLTELAREPANDNGERELADAWMTGDIARLAQEDERGILADPELRAALLVNRNRAWTARITPLIDGGRVPFVAVGASHLIGPDGLPAMLGNRGYTVRRVR